ncbi:Hypothetical protein FKW44_025339, partial [Caligus rogercresseyi]
MESFGNNTRSLNSGAISQNPYRISAGIEDSLPKSPWKHITQDCGVYISLCQKGIG